MAAPEAGMKWTMMRHGNKVKHLGRPADQRKALIRSLVTETLRHGQIRTTKVCACTDEEMQQDMPSTTKSSHAAAVSAAIDSTCTGRSKVW